MMHFYYQKDEKKCLSQKFKLFRLNKKEEFIVLVKTIINTEQWLLAVFLGE
jgi:hypothetical protein